jgi:hypothetical protein
MTKAVKIVSVRFRLENELTLFFIFCLFFASRAVARCERHLGRSGQTNPLALRDIRGYCTDVQRQVSGRDPPIGPGN